MAWRPSQYVITGELNNTTPGSVTGFMRFAGMDDPVTFNLIGDFHRDIRGAAIRFTGDGEGEDPDQARQAMAGFSNEQIGKVGDITAGRPPQDYSAHPYLEWYSEDNGRVVVELDTEQVEVIGMPIPAIESDPISRAQQERNMLEFLAGIEDEVGVATVLIEDANDLSEVIDALPPAIDTFTHWVIDDGRIVGEAADVKAITPTTHHAAIRLFADPGNIMHGPVPAKRLWAKRPAPGSPPEASPEASNRSTD